MYNVELHEINGGIKTYTTETIVEALENLTPDFKSLTRKSVLKVEKDGLKSEIILYPRIIKKLLFNKIARQLLAKRLMLTLS